MTIETPVALYLPVDGIDVGPGADLLAAAGITTIHLEMDAASKLSGDVAGRVVALMVGYEPVGADLFDRFPALRIVATHSAGVDMVDLDAARARGVWVSNVPSSATEEVASHALALALSLLRKIPSFTGRVRSGQWSPDPAAVPRRLSTLTCGVVGLGRIGSKFAQLAAPLFGHILGYDPALPADRWPAGVTRMDLEELLSAADCVSLHLPLTPETTHLLDTRRLSLLRRDAVVINVSRGGLIDEDALIAALTDGHLAGAGLDVLAAEPPVLPHPLLSFPDVLITPHTAYLSVESDLEYATVPAKNVLSLLRTGDIDEAVIAGGSVV